jgi:hypothetical protein
MKEATRQILIVACTSLLFFHIATARTAAENRLIKIYRSLLLSPKEAHKKCRVVKKEFEKIFTIEALQIEEQISVDHLIDIIAFGMVLHVSDGGKWIIEKDARRFINSYLRKRRPLETRKQIISLLQNMQRYIFTTLCRYLFRYDPTSFHSAFVTPNQCEPATSDNKEPFFTIKVATKGEVASCREPEEAHFSIDWYAKLLEVSNSSDTNADDEASETADDNETIACDEADESVKKIQEEFV